MFEFTESISVKAPPESVWNVLLDVEQWWLPSNPEHIRIEVRTPDRKIDVGAPVSFEERVAGIKGKADGTITRFVPGAEITWEGDALYRYAAIHFRVREGVSWRIEGHDAESTLSANVWARFPSGMFGRFLEWYAKTVMNVVQRDKEHARCELEYLKSTIEAVSY